MLADLKISHYTFGEANKEPMSFLLQKKDGICGMAFPGLSVGKAPPLFTSIVDQNLLADPSFSTYFNSDPNSPGSVMILGGVDESYGKIEHYHELIDANYWLLQIDKIAVRNKTIIDEPTYGAVDTGTSLIIADSSYIDKLNSAIGKVNSKCQNLDDLPDVTVTINGVDYQLSSSDYVLKERIL